MSDGDYKKIVVRDRRLRITPHGNNQSWIVESNLDTTKCAATIDFNVHGKPNPPPCNLTATIWAMHHGSTSKVALEFTDPAGQLDPDPTEPINEWVMLTNQGAEL